jgi:polyhydroxybutyrate depolymerase
VKHVALVLVCVVAVSCSGDDDDSPRTAVTTGATTTTAATTSSTLRSPDPEPSAACGQSPAVPPGEEVVTVASGGADRTYVRHVPPVYDGTTPVPVVIDLPGYAEEAELHTVVTQLGPFGDEHGFVTITPRGSGPIPTWDVAPDSADVAFFGDLLAAVDDTLCVDKLRIYVTGYSGGAMMTARVACTYPDLLAAVAPVEGIQDLEDCNPVVRVPMVVFHGDADPLILYEGGFSEEVAELPAPDGSGRTMGDLDDPTFVPGAPGPSVPSIVAKWADRNRCVGDPTDETITDDVTLARYTCPNGGDVALYTIEGGGHTWPGSEFTVAAEGVLGKTTMSIDANELTWEFFENHRAQSA